MERMALSAGPILAGQMLRYGVTGVGLAAVYAAVLWTGATFLEMPAQLANAAGFIAALLAGYMLHSKWSFRGHGSRSGWSWGRFLLVNIAGYLLNCLWVWLMVHELDRSIELAIVPIVTITPLFTFLINRRWTFA